MTSIIDAIFGESDKIYKREFNDILRKLSDISVEERKYLNEAFASDLKDGLTRYELKQRTERLSRNYNDPLEPEEVKQVKNKLLKGFDD